jgi:hypothetical protein
MRFDLTASFIYSGRGAKVDYGYWPKSQRDHCLPSSRKKAGTVRNRSVARSGLSAPTVLFSSTTLPPRRPLVYFEAP